MSDPFAGIEYPFVPVDRFNPEGPQKWDPRFTSSSTPSSSCWGTLELPEWHAFMDLESFAANKEIKEMKDRLGILHASELLDEPDPAEPFEDEQCD